MSVPSAVSVSMLPVVVGAPVGTALVVGSVLVVWARAPQVNVGFNFGFSVLAGERAAEITIPDEKMKVCWISPTLVGGVARKNHARAPDLLACTQGHDPHHGVRPFILALRRHEAHTKGRFARCYGQSLATAKIRITAPSGAPFSPNANLRASAVVTNAALGAEPQPQRQNP